MKKNENLKKYISWCSNQRRGIKIEKPNDNLCSVYIKKAKSSLNIHRVSYQ